MSLLVEIKKEEGFMGNPYYDHLGFQTIGYGTKLPIDEYEAEMLLKYRLGKMMKELHARLDGLDVPQEVWELLYHMAYQLGVSGVLKFKNMVKALQEKDFKQASVEMLDSRWASQTPNRAKRMAERMRAIS